jgi:hypothetical protein
MGSICIDRLLAGARELDARRELGDIYQLRSTIVHGGANRKIDLDAASWRALEITLAVLRVLVCQRQDLISRTSEDRSTTILPE